MENKNRQLKEQKVSEIKDKMSKAKIMILSKYQGLTVEEDTELRKNMRTSGVDYKVYKNTLMTRAANELGYGAIDQYLEGPISVAFGYEDPTAAAKVLNDFSKNHKSLELKVGMANGEIYDADKLKVLATIPSREVLIAKFLGSIKSPMANFAYMLSAVKDKKESEAEA